MAGFSDQYAMSQDTAFRNDLKIAMAKVALQVQGEAISAGPYTDAQWRKRAALATNVLGVQFDQNGVAVPGIDLWIDSFAFAVAQNATIGDQTVPWNGLDADMEFQVTAIWDDMAGVTGVDLQ